jgi:hypothetical protein
MATNAVVASTSGHLFDSFVADMTNPRLTSFDLNMNGATAVLTLHFSETVDVSSLQVGDIVLQAASNIMDAQYAVALAGCDVTTTADGPDVVINLSTSKLDALKLQHIALQSSTAWITFADTMVTDVNGLAVIARANGVSALAVSSNYTPDTTKPVLEGFEFNMNDGMSSSWPWLYRSFFLLGTMTFDFSEPVDAETLMAILLQLQNGGI